MTNARHADNLLRNA